MVLLDDSNSYWWLVRVVKDSSIGKAVNPISFTRCVDEACSKLTHATVGYLPAEHIETPTERLARLNKHRNIDVRSGTELAHQTQNATFAAVRHNARRPGGKTRNPIKSAMKRTKRKTVQFAEQHLRRLLRFRILYRRGGLGGDTSAQQQQQQQQQQQGQQQQSAAGPAGFDSTRKYRSRAGRRIREGESLSNLGHNRRCQGREAGCQGGDAEAAAQGLGRSSEESQEIGSGRRAKEEQRWYRRGLVLQRDGWKQRRSP